MKYELGQTVFYMAHNVVNSSPIDARCRIENQHEDWASTPEQKVTWTPFGPAGDRYCVGGQIMSEKQFFATRAELIASL